MEYREMEKGYAQTAQSYGKHMEIKWNSYWFLSSTRTRNWRWARDLFLTLFVSINTHCFPAPTAHAAFTLFLRYLPLLTPKTPQTAPSVVWLLSWAKPRKAAADERQRQHWRAASRKNRAAPSPATLGSLLPLDGRSRVWATLCTHPTCLFHHTHIKACWNHNTS